MNKQKKQAKKKKQDLNSHIQKIGEKKIEEGKNKII